jgi:hypothetical protein
MMKQYFTGWAVGSLIMLAVFFIVSQIAFQTSQKVFYIGFIDGAWTDSQPATPHAKMTMR